MKLLEGNISAGHGGISCNPSILEAEQNKCQLQTSLRYLDPDSKKEKGKKKEEEEKKRPKGERGRGEQKHFWPWGNQNFYVDTAGIIEEKN